jgi:hypothetical protein
MKRRKCFKTAQEVMFRVACEVDRIKPMINVRDRIMDDAEDDCADAMNLAAVIEPAAELLSWLLSSLKLVGAEDLLFTT